MYKTFPDFLGWGPSFRAKPSHLNIKLMQEVKLFRQKLKRKKSYQNKFIFTLSRLNC